MPMWASGEGQESDMEEGGTQVLIPSFFFPLVTWEEAGRVLLLAVKLISAETVVGKCSKGVLEWL